MTDGSGPCPDCGDLLEWPGQHQTSNGCLDCLAAHVRGIPFVGELVAARVEADKRRISRMQEDALRREGWIP